MGQFDLGAGITAETANGITGTAYAKLRDTLFNGKLKVEIEVDTVEIAWDITKAPVIVFSPPSADEAKTLTESTLEKEKLQDNLKEHRAEVETSVKES